METMSFTTHSSPSRRLNTLQRHLCATSRPAETTLGCVLIPSDFVMRDEAPPLIARFHNVKMKYHVVELDSEDIIASTYMRAYQKGALNMAAAALVADSPMCDIVGLSCTSFSFSVGISNIRNEFLKGAPMLKNTTDMATAQIDGIRAVGGKKAKVALLTPYIEEVSVANAVMLENAGFQVVARLTMNLSQDKLTSRVLPNDIALWAQRVNSDDADVVVIGCSAFRACQPNFLDELETKLGKPVVTSTQAFLWSMLRGSGRSEKINGYGKLFSAC